MLLELLLLDLLLEQACLVFQDVNLHLLSLLELSVIVFKVIDVFFYAIKLVFLQAKLRLKLFLGVKFIRLLVLVYGRKLSVKLRYLHIAKLMNVRFWLGLFLFVCIFPSDRRRFEQALLVTFIKIVLGNQSFLRQCFSFLLDGDLSPLEIFILLQKLLLLLVQCSFPLILVVSHIRCW